MKVNDLFIGWKVLAFSLPALFASASRAFIIYFTHPYGQDFPEKDGVLPLAGRRSSLQAAELQVQGGNLQCDRDEPFRIQLLPPERLRPRDSKLHP